MRRRASCAGGWKRSASDEGRRAGRHQAAARTARFSIVSSARGGRRGRSRPDERGGSAGAAVARAIRRRTAPCSSSEPRGRTPSTSARSGTGGRERRDETLIPQVTAPSRARLAAVTPRAPGIAPSAPQLLGERGERLVSAPRPMTTRARARRGLPAARYASRRRRARLRCTAPADLRLTAKPARAAARFRATARSGLAVRFACPAGKVPESRRGGSTARAREPPRQTVSRLRPLARRRLSDFAPPLRSSYARGKP